MGRSAAKSRTRGPEHRCMERAKFGPAALAEARGESQ
jgi:hypothetical protein